MEFIDASGQNKERRVGQDSWAPNRETHTHTPTHTHLEGRIRFLLATTAHGPVFCPPSHVWQQPLCGSISCEQHSTGRTHSVHGAVGNCCYRRRHGAVR